jgi:hypothetical protein
MAADTTTDPTFLEAMAAGIPDHSTTTSKVKAAPEEPQDWRSCHHQRRKPTCNKMGIGPNH